MTRSLHLIDIENLAAGGAYDAFDRLERHLDATWTPGDFVTLASNPGLWRQLAWEVPVPHRYVVPEPGPDSADRALLANAEGFDLSTFDRVVIGSGDHIFTALAQQAATSGAQVVVVANRGTVAQGLKLATHEIHLLPSPAQKPRVAA